MSSKSKLILILRELKDNIRTPSDIVVATGLPRYEILGSMHVLEALEIVKIVHSKGNYKLYTLSKLGESILEALENNQDLSTILNSNSNSTGQQEAEA